MEINKKSLGLFGYFQKYGTRASPSITFITLVMICILAFIIRIFAVIRYEVIIHEFDPWFNFRVTKYLTDNGAYAFFNYYDTGSWYPLGRIIGGTTYPGIMFTSASIHKLCNTFLFPVDIRNICVFLSPIFAALSSISAYYFMKEVTGRNESGLLTAFLIAIVPGYLSRSTAGGYDNEAVSITALIATFFLYIKALNTGSILWSTICSLMYFYMVSAWGGYVFIINLIPLFTLFLMIIGRTDIKVYTSYSVFYILGTLLSMQIPFVSFGAIKSGEHFLSHIVFILLNVLMLVHFVKSHISEKMYYTLIRFCVYTLSLLFTVAFLYFSFKGYIQFGSRIMTLLDPTYASKYIPIVESVSEHQATTWSAFFFDLHCLLFIAPLGFYYAYLDPTNMKLFVAVFGVCSVYFSCCMVRLLLLSSPALCLLSGLGISDLLHYFAEQFENYDDAEETKWSKKVVNKYRYGLEVILTFCTALTFILITFLYHSTWTAAEAYASPSIILSSTDRFGKRHIIDDFREAYYWLRMNTDPDAKIVSWWDYGYQISGLSGRPVIVDNNTWNTSHIATAGAVFANEEEESYKLCKLVDASYTLVMFGGYSGFSSSDLNKFVWMIKISSGYYPRIKEENFFATGWRVDEGATDTMKNSMMYSFSYYRFDEVRNPSNGELAYDSSLNSFIGRKNIKLKRFKEAFTSRNWIVRIYSVNDWPNRDVSVTSRFSKRKSRYKPVVSKYHKLKMPKRY